MSRVDIPNQDSLYQEWIARFASVATTNAVALGFSTGQTTAMTGMSTAFASAYSDSQDALVTAKSKVGAKNNARSASEAMFRSFAKLVNANDNISDELKAELGINISPSTAGPVVSPSSLAVDTASTGVNTLTWKRNGNVSGTTYMIEAKLWDATEWTMINSSTALKFEHTGQLPGQQIAYRVSAKRAGIQSVPCNPVVAYLNTEAEVIPLPLAA